MASAQVHLVATAASERQGNYLNEAESIVTIYRVIEVRHGQPMVVFEIRINPPPLVALLVSRHLYPR